MKDFVDPKTKDTVTDKDIDISLFYKLFHSITIQKVHNKDHKKPK